MTVLKQASKKRKRSPLMPLYGLIIAVALFVLAFVLEKPLGDIIKRLAPTSSIVIPPADLFPGQIGIAIAIWIILLIFAFTLVALLAGKAPDSAKDLEMPPRTKAERDRRYGGDR